MTADGPSGSADQIKRLWEARAHSQYREFYVASHRGWNDDERVEHQARFDAAIVLHDLEAAWLSAAHVLEIGAGSGRLAAQIAPRVASYSGVDIAPGMVAVANERLAAHENTRVVVGSGDGFPSELTDRRYALVFSHAVLIHCPRDIVAGYVRDGWPLVAPGGRLRLQLRADADDLTGMEPPEMVPDLGVAPPPAEPTEPLADEQRELAAIESELQGTYYMGHAFRYAEVEAFVRELTEGVDTLRVRRFEPEHIYVELIRGAS